MTTALQNNTVHDGSSLPDDLSLFIGKKTLAKFILEGIEDLDAWAPGVEETRSCNPNFRPAMLLTLLAYCYATGVYGSADIQLATEHDQMIRYLCAGDYPDLCLIRSFRRYNHERITRSLSGVLRRVWELRFCEEDAVPIGSVSSSGSAPGWWIGVSALDFRQEAEQRIVRAVRADSMAMDV